MHTEDKKNDSVESLKGCFLSTDWNVFYCKDIDIPTEALTDYWYINFCTDNAVAQISKLILKNR